MRVYSIILLLQKIMLETIGEAILISNNISHGWNNALYLKNTVCKFLETSVLSTTTTTVCKIHCYLHFLNESVENWAKWVPQCPSALTYDKAELGNAPQNSIWKSDSVFTSALEHPSFDKRTKDKCHTIGANKRPWFSEGLKIFVDSWINPTRRAKRKILRSYRRGGTWGIK